MKSKAMFVFVLFLSVCYPAAASERVVAVNFTTGTLSVIDHNLGVILTTPIVLPKRDYYALPVTGRITKAEMGPSWTPTPNMHRTKPGYFRGHYGPYEQGNAMGHCKLTIDFDQPYSNLQYVRIHGNAQDKNLGGRYSAGCIRVPDTLCDLLVLFSQNATVIFSH